MKRLAGVLVFVALWPAAGLLAQAEKKPLTVDLVVHSDRLAAPGISGIQWRPEHEQISFIRRLNSKGTLRLYDPTRKEETLLFDPGGRSEKLSLSSYQWSPKGDAILLEGDHDLWLFEVGRGELRRLTRDAEEEEDATFSPAGEKIAFVKKNNIVVLDIRSGTTTQLTSDGSENVLNGRFDWVYQEELAFRATNRAYEWSPDGKKIAFLRLDDAPVPEYPLTDYLATHATLTKERFPQPGDVNPVPSFHVVTVSENPKTYTFPLDHAQAEYLGPEFAWTPDSSAIAFLTINRPQTDMVVHLWNPVSGNDRTLVEEKDPYWVNSLEPPHFLGKGERFLWLSERSGWQHLYLYDFSGRLVKQLTRGDWMIDRPAFEAAPIFRTDEQGGWVYFAATEKDPRERHLYRVRLDGSGFERLTQEAGTHTLDLSPSGDFLVDNFSSLSVPPQTRLLKSDGASYALLDKPENHYSEYALARTEMLELKAPDGTLLYASLTKPPDFDPHKKYPVIVSIYGGPHAQVVRNAWGGALSNTLDTQEGFLVWSLDNRGSWGRGHAWETTIFKNLGHQELEDQLVGIDYLKSLPYVDAQHLVMFGWSYGGYFTLYSLTHAPEVFACGAAGAPVTDWKFYDSIYTERYMRTPQENSEGYKTSSPLEAAGKLRAKLLLIHGTSDDNVHMQNTINFLQALIEARKPFELYIQPGQQHGFGSEAAQTYLEERLLRFFRECR